MAAHLAHRREVGKISIFKVDSTDELRETLSSLPFFPYMDTEVTALCCHLASIDDGQPAP